MAGPNGLSRGPAPNAFKGFESGTQPVACGGSWTADAGKSGGPPTAVPQFMAMVVSSHFSQTGSRLNGDVEHIVTVQTNSGYGPDRDSAGTGTVIGQLC